MINPWDFSHDHTKPRLWIVAVIVLAILVISDAIYHEIDKRLIDTPRAGQIIRDVAMLAVIGLALYLVVIATS